MAAWDGQGRPEWGHGVNRRERRTDGTRIVYIYIYICFGGRLYPSSSSSVAVVFLLSFAMCFLFCFGSLEIITGVSLVSESSSSFESSSFPDDDVFFLSLTTLLHTPGSFLSSFSSERGSAAGEDRHACGHHRPQNGTGEDF